MASRATVNYLFGPFRLDAADRLLYRDGQLVPLPPKVFDTLLVLVANSGHLMAKDEMMKQLWPDTFVEEGTLTQYISQLRKVLGERSMWIENHPRRGYRFTAPVERVDFSPGEPRTNEASRSPTANVDKAAAGHRGFGGIRVVVAAAGSLVAAAAVIAFSTNGREAPRVIDSVAVLPFRTVSDGGPNYLADGVTESLITRLTNLKGLRVVSYSRVRRFNDSSEEAAAIGRQLGVDVVIEGTVRFASGRLRVSAHGVDTKSGYTIWSFDRFEARPERLLDIEGQLAEAVARRVRGQLTAGERSEIAKSGTTNAEAHDLVLKARAAQPEVAVEILNRAVQLDPGFASAHGWLALVQYRTYAGGRAGPETLRKAISNANIALSKDPDCAAAIRALVHIHHANGREVEALLMARRALESTPDDLDAIAAAGEAYFRNGLYDRAIPLYEQALAGEPTNREFRQQLARMYLYRGEIENGLEVISPLPVSEAGIFAMLLYAEAGQTAKAVEIARGASCQDRLGFTPYICGYVLDDSGDRVGAEEIWTSAVRNGRPFAAEHEEPDAGIWNATIYAKLGMREQALRILQRLLATDPNHPVRLFFAAQTSALLGLRRQALATLKAAVENGFFNLPMLEYHTRPGLAFHAFQGDPEFDAIRAEMSRRIDDLRAQH